MLRQTMGGPQRTNTAIKFIVCMLVGILPLLVCALLVTSSSSSPSADAFKQWGNAGSNAKYQIDYGFMWLIGILVYILTFPIVIVLTRITNGAVKLDVIPSTGACALAMLNMFVIPHSHAAFLILSIPAFALIGYVVGAFVMVMVYIKAMQSQVRRMQQDPQMKEAMDQMQRMAQGQNPNQPKPNNQGKNIKKDDYKQNPYVDVPEDEEEGEND